MSHVPTTKMMRIKVRIDADIDQIEKEKRSSIFAVDVEKFKLGRQSKYF